MSRLDTSSHFQKTTPVFHEPLSNTLYVQPVTDGDSFNIQGTHQLFRAMNSLSAQVCIDILDQIAALHEEYTGSTLSADDLATYTQHLIQDCIFCAHDAATEISDAQLALFQKGLTEQLSHFSIAPTVSSFFAASAWWFRQNASLTLQGTETLRKLWTLSF